MDSLGRFGVYDGNRHPTKKSERYEALLSVVESVVLERECRTLEYSGRVEEVQAVNLQVGQTFPFVPRELHMQSVYTGTPQVKSATARLPRQRPAAQALERPPEQLPS